MTAPAELVIEVTADDIRLGERDDVCRCPIARAVARLLGAPVAMDVKDTRVAVDRLGLAVWFTARDNAEGVPYLLPVEAQQFVSEFDNELPVAPFTFTARLQTESAS